jgi:hypothetical protein
MAAAAQRHSELIADLTILGRSQIPFIRNFLCKFRHKLVHRHWGSKEMLHICGWDFRWIQAVRVCGENRGGLRVLRRPGSRSEGSCPASRSESCPTGLVWDWPRQRLSRHCVRALLIFLLFRVMSLSGCLTIVQFIGDDGLSRFDGRRTSWPSIDREAASSITSGDQDPLCTSRPRNFCGGRGCLRSLSSQTTCYNGHLFGAFHPSVEGTLRWSVAAFIVSTRTQRLGALP